MTTEQTNHDTSAEVKATNTFPFLFEISWEVCNQVGGIYTVIKTKTPKMLERWDNNYFLIGPLNPQTAAIEFEEEEAPALIRETIQGLCNENITCCRYGRWLTTGKPQAILVDYRQGYATLDRSKYFLWKDHGIETPPGDQEINDAVAFGFCVFEFFRKLSKNAACPPLIAHFHEWMAGVAAIRQAHIKLPAIVTLFTTHSTLLGRYMAGDNPSFYNSLDYINPEQTAAHYNISSRHAIEKASAHAADIFTTISEVTGREAEKILGRRPDFILPNGLMVQRFTALHEFQNLHLKFKERIHEFVMGHFFPSYNFDLDRTLYMFIAGRYEYRNKGMDVFIEALHRLNWRLKQISSPPTVVAFIVTRANVKNVNVTTLQNQIMFNDLKRLCDDIQEGMTQRFLHAVAQGRLPKYEEFLPEYFQTRLKRGMHSLRNSRMPGIVTHDLADDGNDPVLRHLRHRGLLNRAEDPVKVIFHPEFVVSTSPLLGLDYDDFVRGCHMGIFPSYYEPWGYTPPECLALGVPTVTSDLSGFGSHVQHSVPDAKEHGIFVLNRSRNSVEQSIHELSEYLVHFVQMSRRERIQLRNRAERISELFDWSNMLIYYHRAHDRALDMLRIDSLG